jgi:hypothetical protein
MPADATIATRARAGQIGGSVGRRTLSGPLGCRAREGPRTSRSRSPLRWACRSLGCRSWEGKEGQAAKVSASQVRQKGLSEAALVKDDRVDLGRGLEGRPAALREETGLGGQTESDGGSGRRSQPNATGAGDNEDLRDQVRVSLALRLSRQAWKLTAMQNSKAQKTLSPLVGIAWALIQSSGIRPLSVRPSQIARTIRAK